MIVADTSAWVGFLRRDGAPAGLELKRLLSRGADIAMTEVVFMELLAGARTQEDAVTLRSRLLAFPMLSMSGLKDYEDAALLFRTCRRNGDSIRTLTDCLIAIPTLREGASLLHADRDFDAIARHTGLKIHRPRA